MPDLPNVVLWSIPAFVLLAILEAVSYRLHPDEEEVGYEVKDTATSVSMGLGSLAFDIMWGLLPALLYSVIYTVTPLKVPFTWQAILLALLAQDFFYYWSHRSHHTIRVLWATHVVHHSSRRFNLSTALRQPWTSFAGFLFYLPMVALGVHPAMLAFCNGVNLVYQFWIHTERIGKLPRPLEFVLNTPSHHRVHHASQGSYLDRNFGGVLIVWDRLFGSFAPELERPVYGLTKNISTYNPVRVAFHEWAAMGRDVASAPTWGERARSVFGAPGYNPAGGVALAPAAKPTPDFEAPQTEIV